MTYEEHGQGLTPIQGATDAIDGNLIQVHFAPVLHDMTYVIRIHSEVFALLASANM